MPRRQAYGAGLLMICNVGVRFKFLGIKMTSQSVISTVARLQAKVEKFLDAQKPLDASTLGLVRKICHDQPS